MKFSLNKWIADNNIDEVEGIVSDMAGIARGKFVPANKFRHEGMRLPESVFIQCVTGEYVEKPVIPPTDPDMDLRPDLNTIRIVPWATDPTASVILDCFYFDGSPVKISPRYVLRRVLDLYKKKGWRPIVAPEVEFYLVKPNLDPDYPLEPPVGRSGRQETVRQAFSIDAINEFEPYFEDIYNFCEVQKIEIDTLIHEGGAGQVEINFVHGDPLDLADQVFLFKRTVRETAFRHNMYATFMAKPMAKEPGSALHLHQSVIDIESGRNIFSDEKEQPTDLFFSFIGGLQKYIPESILLLAPYVNSYRRFARYLSAPINVQWGFENRTVGFRVPRSDSEARRVENRVPGADVNPYIAIATSLACGYIGMLEGLSPSDAVDTSAYDMEHAMPRDLFSALDRLKDCKEIQEILGEKFIEVFCTVKEQEHETFFQVISAWEREFLLLNV